MSSLVTRSLAVIATITALAWAPAARADAQQKTQPAVAVERWLVLGPIASPLPAFNDEDKKTKVGAGELLSYAQIAIADVDPVAGASVALIGGAKAAWTAAAAADTSGVVLAAVAQPSVAYLAAYVHAPRWMKVDVAARSRHAVEVFIDGASVASQKSPAKKDDAKASGSAKLEMGTHLVVVKTVDVPDDSAGAWRVALTLTAGKDFDVAPTVSTNPARTMTIDDVIDGPDVGGIDVSPDGEYVAMSVSSRKPPEGTRDHWTEVHRTRDGSLVRELRDIDGSSWQWAPSGKRLSYVTSSDKKSTVRVIDLETAAITTVLEDVEDFGSYTWSPDGTFIVYSVTTSPDEDKTGVKRMLGVGDRRAGERDRTSLYLASVPEGITRRLTAGEYSARLLDIHPDSKSVLITRTREDLAAGPYESDEVAILRLDDQSVDVLYDAVRWFNTARWSPDGKKILATGGPMMFGEAGVDVPEGMTPNNYDTQAYIIDPATKAVDPITKNFDPAVMSVYWPAPGGDIYVVAEAGEFDRLYRYKIKQRSFSEIAFPTDMIHSRDVARNTPMAVMEGSNANRPPRVYTVDLRSGKSREMLNPTADSFKHVQVGNVEDFNFTSSAGQTIVGRTYLPPDFDPARKWPCIVYYYGGTSPVGRDFGGRYPKNLWAAHGYVVYVLQPSGATGFGQAFSAMHVNDWGKTTADEIIEGTQKFLAAHPYVDPRRVGCIGASFGGFMTELLVTKTDIFAAAVSHAGISDISSYWGEGYWGYQYNAVSAANSFPWNRPDIYIEQSPLFHADKVVTPLLLLHGGADTNVPRGESDQMYAALKLLGKTVEYIRVEGENHWILDYKKRRVWNDAILSWFARWLKDQPEWWNDMYPPEDAAPEK